MAGYLAVAAAMLVGAVFAVAVVGKVRGAAAFRSLVESLAGLAVVPRGLALPVAVLLVLAEAAVVVLLAVPATGRLGLLAAALLLAALTAGVALELRRGTGGSCRCFGVSTRPLARLHLLRNGGLALVAALGAAAPPAERHPAGVALAACAGALLAVLVVRLDDLADLLRAPRGPAPNRSSR